MNDLPAEQDNINTLLLVGTGMLHVRHVGVKGEESATHQGSVTTLALLSDLTRPDTMHLAPAY